MYKKIILVCGMPRSGTSWLGQIFDSSPDVAFRMEPLFSYRFKNVLNGQSRRVDIEKFFDDVYLANDEFMKQKENRDNGSYQSFEKNPKTEYLVMKTTRHHALLPRYLELIDNIEIVSIVRHPCATINSWINTEREFETKGCTIEDDWKSGGCRKGEEGESWGFDDWLAVTRQHVMLCKEYNNFNIVKYSDLIDAPEEMVKNLFASLSLKYTAQTDAFLTDCHSKHNENPYSVFKDKGVKNKWESILNHDIAQEIIAGVKAVNLSEFLD